MQHSFISSAGLPFKALWAAYNRQLHRQPVLTQVCTSAMLWGAGDLLAQRLEAGGHARHETHAVAPPAPASTMVPAASQLSISDGGAEHGIDWRRAMLTGLFGATLVGPVGHFWYIGIDKFCARLFTPQTPQFIAAKVALDTFAMGPFYVAAFFAFGCAFMDGGGWPEFRAKMKTDFWPTLAAEVTFWPVVQTFNFWRVPLEHQLLVVNSMTMLDAAFMSWARNHEDWLGNLLKSLDADSAAKSK